MDEFYFAAFAHLGYQTHMGNAFAYLGVGEKNQVTGPQLLTGYGLADLTLLRRRAGYAYLGTFE